MKPMCKCSIHTHTHTHTQTHTQTHTHAHKLWRSEFIHYETDQDWLVSCLGLKGTLLSPALKMRPFQFSFYHHGTFTSFQNGRERRKCLDNCTNKLNSPLPPRPRTQCIGLYSEEYSISTCFYKGIYVIGNKNNCTAVRKLFCRV